MNHKLLVLFIFLSANVIVKAQDKMAVGVLPFTYAQGTFNEQDVNSIQELVSNAFTKTKRFVIVDRTKLGALKTERELQKGEDFIDSKTIAQGKSLGVSYLVAGHIVSAQTNQTKTYDTKGAPTINYTTQISISLKVMEVATGQVIVSETIEPKSTSGIFNMLIGSSTAQESMSKAIKDIGSKVDQFVAKNFPIMFSIAEIQERDKSGNATKILIAGGSAFGLKKNDKLKVIEIVEMEVDGKKIPRKKEIGELKILNVEDENFSACAVKSGGNDLTLKFNAKANMKVITEAN